MSATQVWGYSQTNGPEKWGDLFETARGLKQSPIDLKLSEGIKNPPFADKKLVVQYEPDACVAALNTGHGFACKLKENSKCSIQGGPLEGEYQLDHFHIHWGSDESQGSEHTKEGRSFAAEIHFVHFNSKYGNVAEATKHNDGLAVLGVFVTTSMEKSGASEEFKKATDQVESVIFKLEKSQLKSPINMMKLLPQNLHQYWHYSGSLTTPPCTECVQWLVLDTPISMELNLLEKLRTLKNCEKDYQENGQLILHNFRPPMPLNGRSLYAVNF